MPTRSINKVWLRGEVDKDPIIRYLDYSFPTATLQLRTIETIALRKGEGSYERTQYHRVSAFASLAIMIEEQVHQGSIIEVEGRLYHHKESDRAGNTRYITEIEATQITVIRSTSSIPTPSQSTTSIPKIDWDSYSPTTDEDPFA